MDSELGKVKISRYSCLVAFFKLQNPLQTAHTGFLLCLFHFQLPGRAD
jgi:hypothetical protein